MVNEKVRRPSGKRFIKNNQQCARYGHLEMAGRDWFLRSPLFPDQRIITQILGIHGEGDQTEGEHSFKQRTILQITVNGGWNVKKKKKKPWSTGQKLLQGVAKFVFKDLWCLLPRGEKEVQSQLRWLQRGCLGRVPVSGLGSAKEQTGK